MKRNNKTGQNEPKPAKRDNGRKGRIFVSQVEQEVMRELHVKGASTRKIATITGRNRETVAKVIKTSEWPKFIERMQEAFYGSIVPAAFGGLLRGVQAPDVRVAAEMSWRVMDRAGIIPPKTMAVQQGNTTT